MISKLAQPGFMRSKAMSGSIAITAAHVMRIFLRLLSSVILTRLLFPEAFGYMAIVTSAMMIISLSTDIGIRPFLVRYPDPIHQNLINVMWSLKLMRGLILFVVIQLLSWPLADFYGDEKIGQLLRIVSYSSLISCIAPLSLFWAEKERRFSFVAGVEFAAFFAQTVGVVLITLVVREYWTLALGALLNAAVMTGVALHLNHYRLPRFSLEKQYIQEIWRFVKWITFGSVIFVAVMQADRFVIGKLFGAQMLGFYAIALTISEALSTMAQNVGNRVGFPTWAEARKKGRVQESFAKFSLMFVPLTGLASGALLLMAQDVVSILYDERYAVAGVLLSILCLRTVFIGLFTTCVDLLIVEGNSRAMFIANVLRLLWVSGALAVVGGLWQSEDIRYYALIFAFMDLPAVIFYTIFARGYRRLFAKNLLYAVVGFVAGGALGYAGSEVLTLIVPWL